MEDQDVMAGLEAGLKAAGEQEVREAMGEIARRLLVYGQILEAAGLPRTVVDSLVIDYHKSLIAPPMMVIG